ncbi:polysaccharide deacetylase family protein [[Eubacterium] cellulosolvens]
MTNDVECFSFEHNRYEQSVAKRVLRQGLPRLLDLYDKYDVNVTFFYTGKIVEVEPEVVDIVKERGKHEIACHGYSHEVKHGFDIMPFDKQEIHIKKAKDIITKAAHQKIKSFRGPMARINADTIKVLEKTGFEIDSSVASQRFDGPLSFGAKGKLKWLYAPRSPYHPSRNNPFQRGDSKIFELPISAFFFAYIGTTMRTSPKINKILQKILNFEAKKGKPIVFIIHPNEVMDFNSNDIIKYTRGKTIMQKMFADKLRLKIKTKCLGISALKRLEIIIRSEKAKCLEFVTCTEYKKKVKGE